LRFLKFDSFHAGPSVKDFWEAALVKDGMEQCGMRWTIDGAEAMLGIRSIQATIPKSSQKLELGGRESCRIWTIVSGLVLINTKPLMIVQIRRFEPA